MKADLYRGWIGRRQIVRDVVAAAPAERLAATLDRWEPPLAEGDPLPPAWHWLYCLDCVPVRGTGPDGHAGRGTFLPPVGLPRRMYAGGRFRFLRPLRVGQAITRTSEIADIAVKAGHTGPLAIVSVRHVVSDREGDCVSEDQTLIYRDAPKPGDEARPEAPPDGAEFHRSLAADPVTLFRFSALTFNGHRIHYDRDHATAAEGYPGLVVHGPLLAILLLDLLRRERPLAALTRFSFRAVRPVFDGRPFRLAGKAAGAGYALWVEDEAGAVAMRAEAEAN